MHTRNHGLAQPKCYIDWDRKTPYRLFGGIVYSPGDEIPAEWIEQESPKWGVPPAQMFADVTWDRIAGAWRFINPLDDPQHHRQAVAFEQYVALEGFLDSVEDCPLVNAPKWLREEFYGKKLADGVTV